MPTVFGFVNLETPKYFTIYFNGVLHHQVTQTLLWVGTFLAFTCCQIFWFEDNNC